MTPSTQTIPILTDMNQFLSIPILLHIPNIIDNKYVYQKQIIQDCCRSANITTLLLNPSTKKSTVSSLQFPEMCNKKLVISEMDPWPLSFPPMSIFHKGHASFKLNIPSTLSHVQSIHIYAVGALIIDGRKYRLQGWLNRISTFPISDSTLRVTMDQPVIYVSKIEHLCMQQIDGVDGEFHTGCLAILPTGNWRLYAVVNSHNVLSISTPTPRMHIHVDDDWELDAFGENCVSLSDLITMYNPNQYRPPPLPGSLSPPVHSDKGWWWLTPKPFMSAHSLSPNYENLDQPSRNKRQEVTLHAHNQVDTKGRMKPIRHACNWKMNGTQASNTELITHLNKSLTSTVTDKVDVVICPPTVYLDQVRKALGSNMAVGAQNCYSEQSGAYTGETSSSMLKELNVHYTILGHSERRELFNESDEFVFMKTSALVASKVSVIFCIGEKLEHRNNDLTYKVLEAQLMPLIKLDPAHWASIVIAYEPVWAIGTGLVATPEQAQQVHAYIRNWLREHINKGVAEATRIIYGGSVNKANCHELAKCADIDGFLVGGASLKPEFVDICKAKFA